MSWLHHTPITDDYTYDPAKDILGVGCYGTVYRCTHITTDQKYALKVVPMRRHAALDEEFMEIEILKRLHHPHCISLREFVVHNDQLFIVQELSEGGELLQYIAQRKAAGGLTESDIRQVMRQILEALVYLHTVLLVVHRDLKPENILVSTQPKLQVKLIDFGQAKFFGRPEDFQHTLNDDSHHGSLEPLELSDSVIDCSPTGTPSYCAFEIVNHVAEQYAEFQERGYAKHCTTRKSIQKVDIFSAGVILYLMLSGRLPFLKGTETVASFGLLRQRMELGLKFPAAFWEKVSASGKDCTASLLRLDPRDRPTALEVLQHPWFLLDEDGQASALSPREEEYVEVRMCAAGMTSMMARDADWSRSTLGPEMQLSQLRGMAG
eukprot:GGOE01045069.1.p1 GENE.GGOE01045069.1~~GGOE01045069.1.p1  ORF type:complete len:379 (-),score=112.19 GGOE01045069.1:957-2093(-)